MATLTSAGYVPTPLTELQAEAIANAVALEPGLTATLPSSLIGDLSATEAGGLAIQDQAVVDIGNSASAFVANQVILSQFGAVYGIPQGLGSNGSVYVIFYSVSTGYTINKGFQVSDGTNTYIVQEPGTIGELGYSQALYCVATNNNFFAIPANSVTQIITSLPVSIVVTCNNPTAGFPATSVQSNASYRYQLLTGAQVIGIGTITAIYTAVWKVPGVIQNLVSIRPLSGGYEILVGGGDPYQVGGAIKQNIENINILQSAATIGTTVTVDIIENTVTYPIIFVVPTQQSVGITVTWELTASANIVANDVVSSLVSQPFVTYINSIQVGAPISLLVLENTFTTATASVMPIGSIAVLSFVVTIDSDIIDPTGQFIIGDPEGYFNTTLGDIIVVEA